MSVTSSRGQAPVKKSILRQVDDLRMTLDEAEEDGTDLEKIKYLQTKMVPRVEKAISELEHAVQKMALVCDDEEMDEISITTDAAIREASQFIRRTAQAYQENEGYAPTLTGLEKALTELKPYAADSDMTIYEWADKFNAYCSGTKRAKAY